MKPKAILLLLGLMAGLTWRVQAQTDDALVKGTLLDYLEGGTNQDTARLNRAFFGGVLQMSINRDGRPTASTKREFMSKVRIGQKLDRTTRILSYSVLNNAATATVESEYADFKYVDYLNLLKVGNDWKIVSRVFTRADKDQQPIGVGTGGKAPVAQKKSATKPKPKYNDGWD
ncbi:MAG: nuclear transport factor 2 family protein [Cytophagaceae bacterium]|nr:nuclear transport factor 2 family protein [Cytophagaceae bacterium]